jgi:hypothetical protein
MAGGAPIGNKNGTKGKLFYEQLRKISVQQPDRLRNVAETLFSAAELEIGRASCRERVYA